MDKATPFATSIMQKFLALETPYPNFTIRNVILKASQPCLNRIFDRRLNPIDLTNKKCILHKCENSTQAVASKEFKGVKSDHPHILYLHLNYISMWEAGNLLGFRFRPKEIISSFVKRVFKTKFFLQFQTCFWFTAEQTPGSFFFITIIKIER